MIRTCQITLAVLLSCLSGAASAGELAYTCQVSHVYSLGINGSLETSPESMFEKSMMGSSFSVSRKTGAIITNLSLDTSLAKSTRVIKRGSSANSFEAVADFGAFENGAHPYQFIKVQEFQKGSAKPFVVMDQVGIVTGICH